MMDQKDVVAMLLAGGQGSRLGILTKKLAKPAVPFGAKYRIIDFTLSNCANSEIDTVGVLTQYQPLTLNSYIGTGSSWDLDRHRGGVAVLPPYVKAQGGEWYKGTANAVYQNLDFMDRFNPKYVLVLSGDHIYRMDYSEMIRFHQEKEASITIAVIEVSWEETHRFGIMVTDQKQRIVDFQEKPKKAKNNLASMGVYVFNWRKLRAYLEADEEDPLSDHDFGKNVIPAMLKAGEPMYAYPFPGYWKDVGTIESLWEANMDLLKTEPQLELGDPKNKVFTVNHSLPPQFVGAQAQVRRSLLGDGAIVLGRVDHSVIFNGACIQEGARVIDSVIMPGASVETGALVQKAIIGEKAVIGAGAQIGVEDGEAWKMIARNKSGITVLEDNLLIPAGLRLLAGAVVSVSEWPDFPEERIS
ncbi:MAG: glucose-1-phosphate adenylyltransferase [Firmicutes bacterium]|nr:glucose-1-phosphate adenylyltransferase [Bacillota bacterium]